ncbi:hypothetical protein BH10BAC5_BH10BAC5_05000 [soil metagenome]
MNISNDNTSEGTHFVEKISVRVSAAEVSFEKDLPPIYTLLNSGKYKQVSFKDRIESSASENTGCLYKMLQAEKI